MTIGPHRKTEKNLESEEIQRQMEEFFARDGHIEVIETQQSEFQPRWATYAVAGYGDRDGD